MIPSEDTALRWIDELGEEAVDHVVEDLVRRHPDLMERLGASGRRACRRDVAHHLEFLAAALAGDEPAIFGEYAAWLRSVLTSRGVPTETLDDSFEALEDFFVPRLSPEDAARVRRALDEARSVLHGASLHVPDFPRIVPDALVEIEPLVQRLVAGDHAGARGIVEGALARGASYEDVGVGVVQAAMYEVGRLWQANRITVAQEHLATAIAQNLLGAAFERSRFSPQTDRKALFACVETNLHGLGLRIVADRFLLEGWNVQYLGADVPTNDLVAQVDAFRPDVVGLSIALPRHVRVAHGAIERLRERMGAATPTILLGGLAANQFERVWRHLRADGWSPDARELEGRLS